MEQTTDRPALVDNKIASNDVPIFLKAPEIAARLRIDLKKVYRLVDSKEIPAFKVGGEWRFIWEDVIGAIMQRSSYGDKIS